MLAYQFIHHDEDDEFEDDGDTHPDWEILHSNLAEITAKG
jgi:hypothetical protein